MLQNESLILNGKLEEKLGHYVIYFDKKEFNEVHGSLTGQCRRRL